MIASIYKELIDFDEVRGDMVSRIKMLELYDIFRDMDEWAGGNAEAFNAALFFILHVYSIESPMHAQGSDWLGIKLKAAQKVGLKEDEPTVWVNRGPGVDIELPIFNMVVHLESPAIVITADRYLQYQQNKDFKHLVMLKDLYEQMVRGSLMNITKNSGEIDFDQKHKNHKYAAEILKEVEEWEQKMESILSKGLKTGKKELGERTPDTSQSLRLEDNLKHS